MPVLLRGLHVVAAAVGVVGAAPLGMTRLFAVEEEQLDRELVLPRLEHAPQLEQRRGGRGAVVGADESELAKQLGVVVAGEDDALAAACPGIVAMTLAIDTSPSGVFAMNGCSLRLDAGGLQLLEDVAGGVSSMAGEPDGPGPKATCSPQVLPGARAVERRRRCGLRLRRCDRAALVGDRARRSSVDCAAPTQPASADRRSTAQPSHRSHASAHPCSALACPAARSPAASAPM